MGQLRHRLLNFRPTPLAIAVTSIVGAAFALRVVGLGFGLPYLFHWDEPTIMNRVIRMGGGDLNPHYFYYPSLLFYIGLALEGAHFAVGHLLGFYRNADAFGVAFFVNPTAFYLVARGFSALVGTATVVVVYRLAAPAVGGQTACLAAALIAVSPIHVSASHFFTTDVLATFLAVIGSLFCLRVYRAGRPADYLAAGVVIGLGASTKYLPGLLAVSLVLSHVLARRSGVEAHRLRWLLAGLAAALAAFVVTSPFVVIDWRAAIDNYRALAAQKSASGCVGEQCQLNLVPYVTATLPWSIGPLAYVAAVVSLFGIAMVSGRRRDELMILASFPLLYFAVIAAGRQPAARYLVILSPYLAIGAAATLVTVGTRFVRIAGLRRAAALAPALLLATALGPPVADSLGFDSYVTNTDPRTRAVEWFRANVPTNQVVSVQPLVDRYFETAQLPTESQVSRTEGYLPGARTKLRSDLDRHFADTGVYPDYPFSYSVPDLEAGGVRYVVISSAQVHNVDPAVEDPFYRDLQHTATVAAVFTPCCGGLGPFYPVTAPTITVYELPADGRLRAANAR